MNDIQKLGEVAHLAQKGKLQAAQRIADSIRSAEVRQKAQDIIDCMKG